MTLPTWRLWAPAMKQKPRATARARRSPVSRRPGSRWSGSARTRSPSSAAAIVAHPRPAAASSPRSSASSWASASRRAPNGAHDLDLDYRSATRRSARRSTPSPGTHPLGLTPNTATTTSPGCSTACAPRSVIAHRRHRLHHHDRRRRSGLIAGFARGVARPDHHLHDRRLPVVPVPPRRAGPGADHHRPLRRPAGHAQAGPSSSR